VFGAFKGEWTESMVYKEVELWIKDGAGEHPNMMTIEHHMFS